MQMFASFAVTMRAGVAAAAIAAVAALSPASAAAANKHAFVVGVDEYDFIRPLGKAVADARAVAAVMESRGFRVQRLINPSRRELSGGMREFLGSIRPGDTTFVFFAGHGVQLDPNRGDTMFLLPSDAEDVDGNLSTAMFALEESALQFARLRDSIKRAGADLAVYVIDACRDNPFTNVTRSTGGTRGLGRVSPVDQEFLAFSASPGEVAYDALYSGDPHPNSVFTRVFLEEFQEGVYLDDVMNSVEEKVATITGERNIRQRPHFDDRVIGKPCLDGECGRQIDRAAIEAERKRFEEEKRRLEEELAKLREQGNKSSFGTLNDEQAALERERLRKGLSEEGFAAEKMIEAQSLSNQGKYREAAPLYRYAADRGNMLALTYLGWMVQTGNGVPVNVEEARDLYRRAAELGEPQAMTNLGILYRDGTAVRRDYAKAREWFDKAREAGNRGALTNLGYLYQRGLGVTQNYSRAKEYYEQAVAQNDPEALANLAWLYDSGNGVAKDDDKAAELYQRAADYGNAYAMSNLGAMYRDGRGVPQNNTKAVELFNKAAEKGNAPAMDNLGYHYRDGIGVTKNQTLAVDWYRRSVNADPNYASAKRNLGWMLEQGLGVNKNMDEAIRLYRAAANLGDNWAQNRLSQLGLR